MVSSAETHPYPANFPYHLIQATTSNVVSLITSAAPKTSPSKPLPPSKVYLPLLFADLPLPPLTLSYPHSSPSDSTLTDSLFPTGHNSSPREASGRGSTAAVRITGLSSGGKGGGPAFVGQVFSMCDLSGTGLMAVSTHFDIPFISKRTPGWMKKMFATITKSERNGPVFRFFMDLGDAVSYVKRLNIPSGVVGACRLDLAYEHFKEKPHLFQFVPNEKQVKAANKILKTIPKNGGRKKVDGVPVFTAQNLDIAIATTYGIKWYTPYFFDKNMLDNILEESVDQHFDGLIQSRRTQRWQDVDDDNLAAEVVEDNKESLWEPPEVQEVMDEMGHPGIPLSVISKAAEMQLLYAVDKVLLGNRWLRKATGIQPRFPYMVDSFEKRSAASFLKASQSSKYLMSSNTACDSEDIECLGTSAPSSKENIQAESNQKPDLRFPFVDWFSHQWSKQQPEVQNQSNMRSKECLQQKLQPSPFLPKITMVGISTSEAGQMSKATLKKTMEDLTEQLEQTDRGNTSCANGNEIDDRDPLFVANIGDYFSGFRTGAAQWAKGKNN